MCASPFTTIETVTGSTPAAEVVINFAAGLATTSCYWTDESSAAIFPTTPEAVLIQYSLEDEPNY